jgi:two-component sensor histidine kinase
VGLKALPLSIDTANDGEADGALFTLVETIEALSSARTVEEVADVIRSTARRITGADGVAIVLRDGDQCHYLDEDAIGPLWKGRRFPLTACVSGWAMLNRKTAVIPDIYQDARVPHDAYRPTFVKSMVMTPVRPEDPVGAIGAYWADAREPTSAELQKLEVMARATAAALESAKLRASLESALAAREALVAELDHRVKNTLAATLSIASQTLRNAPTPKDFNEAFEGRVFSMASAHELLAKADWGPTSLDVVVRSAMDRFGGIDGDRIAASGPPMSVKAEAAVAIHMALHELGENAAQHGALRRQGGKVDIYWSVGYDVVDGKQVAARLVFNWRESGGPVVGAPQRRGFGSKLIEQGLPRELGGEARLNFDSAGLRFSMAAPLSNRLAQAQ